MSYSSEVSEKQFNELISKAMRLSNLDIHYWDGVYAVLAWLAGYGKHPDNYAPEGDARSEALDTFNRQLRLANAGDQEAARALQEGRRVSAVASVRSMLADRSAGLTEAYLGLPDGSRLVTAQDYEEEGFSKADIHRARMANDPDWIKVEDGSASS